MDKKTIEQAHKAVNSLLHALQQVRRQIDAEDAITSKALSKLKFPMQSAKDPFWHVGGLRDGDELADMKAALEKLIAQVANAEQELTTARESATEGTVLELQALLRT